MSKRVIFLLSDVSRHHGKTSATPSEGCLPLVDSGILPPPLATVLLTNQWGALLSSMDSSPATSSRCHHVSRWHCGFTLADSTTIHVSVCDVFVLSWIRWVPPRKRPAIWTICCLLQQKDNIFSQFV